MGTDKNNNFKFTIKFLMTLDRSYIGYLGFSGIDLFKSVLMYSNGAICLIKLLFKMGLFTVYRGMSRYYPGERWECSAGTARTCAAHSAAQSPAPRHHSEIIDIE